MKIIDFLKIIDNKLSGLLGITKNYNTLHLTHVRFSNNLILVFIKEPYKRHKISDNWVNFNKRDLEIIDAITKKKLGAAIGTAIAKDLVISFDHPKIEQLNK